MKITHQQLASALDSISVSIERASSLVERISMGDEFAEATADWFIPLAYTQLTVLCEALELPRLRREVLTTFRQVKKEGLTKVRYDVADGPYLPSLGPARRFRTAVESVLALDAARTITTDLEGILREMTHSISNHPAFPGPPANEDDVHRRAEAILRCVFPDLMHKPPLAKPIKHFVPDTGIPSISTLIEYKYVSDRKQVPLIGDEILADTRGYHSKDWASIVFVIYETERFRSEGEWRQFLRTTGVPDSITAVVLTGNPPPSVKPGPSKPTRTPVRKKP